jgi:hypothetical protein
MSVKYFTTADGQPLGAFVDGAEPPEDAVEVQNPQPVAPTRGQQEFLRKIAYTAEADPLFFKWQAGEATEAEWLAKRQEIRDRYPYPLGA